MKHFVYFNSNTQDTNDFSILIPYVKHFFGYNICHYCNSISKVIKTIDTINNSNNTTSILFLYSLTNEEPDIEIVDWLLKISSKINCFTIFLAPQSYNFEFKCSGLNYLFGETSIISRNDSIVTSFTDKIITTCEESFEISTNVIFDMLRNHGFKLSYNVLKNTNILFHNNHTAISTKALGIIYNLADNCKEIKRENLYYSKTLEIQNNILRSELSALKSQNNTKTLPSMLRLLHSGKK